MDAVHHLLRRSRFRSFAAATGHAFRIDDSILDSGVAPENDSTPGRVEEKREFAQLDVRFYASLNQYSPQQLASMALASVPNVASEVAGAGAAASQVAASEVAGAAAGAASEAQAAAVSDLR